MSMLRAGALLARRYRLIDQIGVGGMSVIWRARDEVLDRLVAVKVLAATLAADGKFRDMVREEARAAAQLDHPHVTGVHDYGEAVAPDGTITAFVVMELLSGEELDARLGQGPLPWAEAVEICAQVAEALAAAHRLGIVHRDVTPANIMLTPTGPKVLDFGIATHVGAPDEDEEGDTFGTPAYVAPERLDGRPAQPATDTYSLGVLLFETLTGDVPYPADTWDDLTEALRCDIPPLTGVPGLPPAVADICARCLSRDPHLRPTARHVGEVLRAELPIDPHAATMLAPTVTLPVTAGGPGPQTVAAGNGPTAAYGPAWRRGPDGSGTDGARAAGVRAAVVGAADGPSTVRVLTAAVVSVTALLAAVLLGLFLRPGTDEAPQTLATNGPGPALGGALEPTPQRSARPSPSAPPPKVLTVPRNRPTQAASREGTRAPRTSAPPVPTLREAVAHFDDLIDDGLASGAIRHDVGGDLREMARALRQSGADVADVARRLLNKVEVRAQEGAITLEYADVLEKAITRLDALA